MVPYPDRQSVRPRGEAASHRRRRSVLEYDELHVGDLLQRRQQLVGRLQETQVPRPLHAHRHYKRQWPPARLGDVLSRTRDRDAPGSYMRPLPDPVRLVHDLRNHCHRTNKTYPRESPSLPELRS